ncbi:MAG: STAS-like domain-containing protein [Pseudomonadota bacterium]
MEEIRLNKYGAVLSTRDLGSDIRRDIEIALDRDNRVTVSFYGLEVITPSFVDECFGHLLLKMGPEVFKRKIRLTQATDATKKLITYVFATRSRQGQTKGNKAA